MSKHNIPLLIAIDGPAASGKTTVGQKLAEYLNYIFLDTGCMYRAVTLAALNENVDIANEEAITNLSQTVDIVIEPPQGIEDGRLYTVWLNEQDVTWAIRTPEVDAHVSQVSAYPHVRHEMVRQQRLLGKQGSIVMVGRDIGTVVMPDAPLKLYIVASAEERARRRWHDRQQQGDPESYKQILANVRQRDYKDSNREHSPLQAAEDAIVIDTTSRSVDVIVQEILGLIAQLPAIPC